MADVREKLARLNPKTIQFDIGRGGIADLTDQDIAAALAFVPAGLGREVLIACWWPDGSSPRKILDGVLAAVSAEWRRQGDRLQDARTELGIAEACAGWNRHTSPEQRREVERAKARYEQVRDQCWPRETGAMLPVIIATCVEEIASRHQCPDCEGRGERLRGELTVVCAKCSGTGIVSVSERHRAQRLGRHHESYRRHWAPVYGWVLQVLLYAEQEAAHSLASALVREAA